MACNKFIALVTGLLPIASALDSLVPEPRIVGGEVVNTPLSWMASLQMRPNLLFEYVHLCGGSLIDPTHVLTAAHCIVNDNVGVDVATNNEMFRVAVGGLLQTSTRVFSANRDEFEYYSVSKVYLHPNYNTLTQDNDIAILELASSSNLAPLPLNIASATLPANDVEANEVVGSMLTVYGWGLTNPRNDSSASNELRKVQVPVYPQRSCHNRYGASVTASQICAGFARGGRDACQGDSGGPANSATGYQVGIVSMGTGCALPLTPGIYTRVSSYADWINEVLGGTMAATPGNGTSTSTSSGSPTAAPAPTSTSSPSPTSSAPMHAPAAWAAVAALVTVACWALAL